MATHPESRTIGRPPEEIFDNLPHLGRYPEFLPLISTAKIVKRHENAYETEQSLALVLMTHRFRTRTMLDRPRGITVVSDARSFCRFDIRWQFAPLGDDRCHVDFSVDCEADSPFLLPVIRMLVLPLAVSMVAAFEARALRLAGDARRPEPRDEP